MTIRELMPWTRQSGGHLSPVQSLQKEMNELFDHFFRGVEAEPFSERGGRFTPAVDVAESDKEFAVTAELPGLDEKDLDISVTRDALTIRGEKKEEHEEKDNGRYHKELYYGSFSRNIPLHTEVNPDAVKAVYKNGVLKVKLPKAAPSVSESRKITVRSGKSG